jgi:hypothetical protein
MGDIRYAEGAVRTTEADFTVVCKRMNWRSPLFSHRFSKMQRSKGPFHPRIQATSQGLSQLGIH